MKSVRWRVASILLIAVLTGAAIHNLDTSPFLKGDAQTDTDNRTETSQKDGVEVLDCRGRSYLCKTSRIEYMNVSCEPWQPWNDISEISCGKTSEGMEDISLVTDPANFVQIPRTDANYTVERVARTKAGPWDLAFLPGGDIIWTRKNGNISVYRNGSVHHLDTIDSIKVGEAGLMGVAAHPDFSSNRYIYLQYAHRRTNRTSSYSSNTVLENRISRFKLAENGLTGEKVIKTVPGSKWHSGGRLEFGPDGKLYATTGDADNPIKAAHETSYLGGSILRMNPDGSVPQDNPFNNSVYSMGHRNPQGIAWNPETGVVYNSEHGPWRHDELNRVIPGENYGWGEYKCSDKTELLNRKGTLKDAEPPVKCFQNWTMAPSGMTFVDDPGHPWYGDLFLAGLRGKQIYRAEIEGGEIVEEEVFYVSDDESSISLRLRHVDYRNGSLYVLGDKEGLVKLTPSSMDRATG